MAKKVLIVGGDGFARECYCRLMTMRSWNPEIVFSGFLGHGGYGATVDYKTYQGHYLGEVSDWRFSDDEYVVIGAGYPSLRQKIYNELAARQVKFLNLVDAPINETVRMGEANVIVGCGALSTNVVIGSGNVFNCGVIVGHDVEVGDFNFFGPNSQLLGYVHVGNGNSVGAGSVILPHAKIGDNNKIAPLSAVYRGCRDNAYLLGNPAMNVG